MLIQRVFNDAGKVIFSPVKFWDSLKEGGISRNDTLKFVIILAAIPPVFSFLGLAIFRMNSLKGIGIWNGIIVFLILSYITFILLPFIMGYIIDKVAATLGGKTEGKGWHVAVYSSTPFYLASAINIIPPLFPLSLIGALYTITLLFISGNRVFELPPEKQPLFTFVISSIWLILTFIFALLLGALSLGGIVVGVPVRF